jgi:L-serine/L-threonine ammonia-lyase
MQPLHIETPTINSFPLSIKAGRPVMLKLEALQPSGSFKLRGVGFACQEHARLGAKRFISSSGGNAGIAVAYSGRLLSIPVVVVVPKTTSERAKQLIQQEGADVIIHGASWQEANSLALSMIGETDVFIHPFDDPLLWRGHATMIDEIANKNNKPDVIILSVGGGGLLSGVIEGLHRNNWQDVPVLAVETEGANSFAQSVKTGSRIELPAITSIATSLGARKVSEDAFNCYKKHPIQSIVVTDKAAVSACQQFITDHRIVVEPACGAALAIVYERMTEIEHYKSILVIVCGGATATIEQLNQWSETQNRQKNNKIKQNTEEVRNEKNKIRH